MLPAGCATRCACVPARGEATGPFWTGVYQMTDYSKLTKAQLVALAEASSTTARVARKAPKAKAAKRGEPAKRTQNVTESFTLVTDRRAGTPEGTNARGEDWASKYAELAFCDAEGNAHVGALREDDVLGIELREEIKSYAKANPSGRSRMRFNRKIGAWTAPLVMFPPRLIKLAGI